MSRRRLSLATFFGLLAALVPARSMPGVGAQAPASTTRPELIVQSGHVSVSRLAFSPDGRWILASGDPTNLWEVTTGRAVQSFTAAGLGDGEFTRDGRWITFDQSEDDPPHGIRIFDAITGEEVRPAAGNRVLAMSPDRRMLALAVPASASFSIWDSTAQRVVRTLVSAADRLYRVQFSPTGQWILAEGFEDDDKVDGFVVQVWDAASGAEAGKLVTQVLGGVHATFSSDGSRFALSVGDSRKVEVWDVASWRKVHDLQREVDGDSTLSSFTYSADGRWIAAAGTRDQDSDAAPRQLASAVRTVDVWSAATGQRVASLSTRLETISELVFSPDGRWLLAGGFSAPGSDEEGLLLLWDAAAGWQRRPMKATWTPALAVSADSRWVATENSGEIRIEEVATGRTVRQLRAPVAGVGSIAVSSDGRWIAASEAGLAGLVSGHFKLWDTATGNGLRVMEGGVGKVQGLDFTPDGQLITIGYGSATLWEPATGLAIRTFAEGKLGIGSASICADGRSLALSRSGGNDVPWHVEMWDVTTGRAIRRLPGRKSETTESDAVVFSPDCRMLAFGGKLWDAASGRELFALPEEALNSDLAFSRDGSLLAIGESVWSVDARREVRKLSTTQTFGDVGFSPDGRWLAATSVYDDTVQIWDLTKGWAQRSLAVAARTLTFTSDSRWLLTGGRGEIRIWNPATVEMVATLVFSPEPREWLVATPMGLFDGSTAGWRRILWRFGGRADDVAPVEAFFGEFYAPGLLATLFSGDPPRPPRDLAAIDRRFPVVRLSTASSAASSGGAATAISVRIDVTEAPGDSGHAAGSGARDLRLFRNGSLVKAWRGDVVAPNASRATLEATVSLVAGDNRLVAYAFNRDNVKSEDAELTVTVDKAQARPGVAYIVAVGIDRYANAAFDLKYAVADATEFGRQLAEHQRALGAFARVEVALLLNEQATRSNILRALARLSGAPPAPGDPQSLSVLAAAQPQDLVALFFAGHGMAAGDRFYLLPHDLGYAASRDAVAREAAQQIAAHSMSDQDLERAFESVGAGHLLLVIDACHSGQALEAAEKRLGPMNSKGLAQLAFEKGMHVLTAAQSYQAALEAERLGHGLLTFALVEEGLRQGAADRAPRDGSIELREWLDYAVDRVPQMQWEALRQPRALTLAFVGGEANLPADRRSLQRPRVFYRRDAESEPLRIARRRAPATTLSGSGLSGVDRDRAAADAGDPDAQYRLGVAYLRGEGVEQDPSQAAAWLRRAADQEHTDAQYRLGAMYWLGRGVPQDFTWSARLLEKAAAAGHATAQEALGSLYEFGRGVPKDPAIAVAWYRKAAEQGYVPAYASLGAMFEDPWGLAKDDAEALRWYRKAAEQRNAEGQWRLARMYEEGRGVARDDAQALRWYGAAAEQNDGEAQWRLGRMYEDGRGTAKNEAQAVAWYRKAADNDQEEGQWRLARMHEEGRGTAKDERQAAAWYRKAAERFAPEALYRLGQMYLTGRGVTKDEKEARSWLEKAAAAGHEEAKAVLQRLPRLP